VTIFARVNFVGVRFLIGIVQCRIDVPEFYNVRRDIFMAVVSPLLTARRKKRLPTFVCPK